jgi:hypothetical protein
MTARTAQPRHTNPIAGGEPLHVRAEGNDPPHCLVPWNDSRLVNRKVTLGNVEICPAHTAGAHSDEEFVVGGTWNGEFRALQRMSAHRTRQGHCPGCHHAFSVVQMRGDVDRWTGAGVTRFQGSLQHRLRSRLRSAE